MENKFINYILEKTNANNSAKKYAGAIKSISKHIVQKNIFDINDFNEFEKLKYIVIKNPEFIKMNQRGNNMYSCSLSHYGNFLKNYYQFTDKVKAKENFPREELTENIFPEEINCDKKFPDGAVKSVKVNMYERNPKARAHCIKSYGNDFKCQVCGFKFADKYGDAFKQKIHVHHIKPLHEIGEQYQVNPATDLIPVCPNCHMILHSKGKDQTYTVDEVKEMLKHSSKELF